MWYIIFMHQDPSIHVSTVRIIDKSLLGPQFPKEHSSSSHIACSGVSCFCIVARTPKIYNKAPRRTAVLGKHLNYMIWTLSYWEACHFHMNRTSLNIFSPKQRATSIEFRWVFSELLGFAGRDWSGTWARDGGPGSFLKMLMNPKWYVLRFPWITQIGLKFQDLLNIFFRQKTEWVAQHVHFLLRWKWIFVYCVFLLA